MKNKKLKNSISPSITPVEEELILNETYKIKTTEKPRSSVVLTSFEKENFKLLNSKTKLSRLSHIKEKRKVEDTLISIVSQSRFLKLYKDNTSYHLRLYPDLDDEDISLEMKIVDYLIKKYPVFINEEINTGMSGDINRVIISKGTNIIED